MEREHIMDKALELAERGSWEALRLHEVAAELGLTLDEMRTHFREKEDIAEAWFDRADAAMLREAARPDVATLSPRQRIQRLIMAWLDALGEHRRLTRQMILNKLEPGHLHYQLAGWLRVSRTVQWLREGAHLDAVFPRRAVEETVLTGIYLASFARWMTEKPDGAGPRRSEALLDRLLAGAECLARAVSGKAGPS